MIIDPADTLTVQQLSEHFGSMKSDLDRAAAEAPTARERFIATVQRAALSKLWWDLMREANKNDQHNHVSDKTVL